jgi:zinc protease
MSWTLECEAPMGKLLQVRRHRLHNGLCLVSLADSSAPLVSYQTWFAVGSRNEVPGATGMAHLFEHLMFNQTRNMPVGMFDRRIEATGGDTNAATWVDWTYYRDSVPARDLPLVIELEAERMVGLVLEHDVVEAEREVVMNERLQRVDDDIDGFANEELFRHAFEEHPYHWPTIGWMDDIKSLSIPDIHAFYQRYYSPDNATLVVVGDFEEAELMAQIESRYGDIPASGLTSSPCTPEPLQTKERRFDYRREVSSPRLLNGYKSPGQGDDDWPLVYFTCQLLAGSASSPLYRDIVVEKELASSLSCDVMPFSDPALIEISATATRESSLDLLQDAIDATLTKLTSSPVADSEIHKVRNLVETEFWGGLTTIDGKAEALGHYQAVHGDFRRLFTMAERLASVDASDVQQVLKTYFQPARRTVIRIEPEDEVVS